MPQQPPPLRKFRFVPEPEKVGERIDKALGSHPEVGSRSRAESLIEHGRVQLKGRAVKCSYRIETGNEFDVEIVTEAIAELRQLDLDLDILFEDDALIVLHKPAGLVVHPAAGHAEDTLVNALVSRPGFAMKFGEMRPGIVHRLDKDTSGLLVVAKNDFAQHSLVEQFKARSIHRSYQAIVQASQLPESGTIQSYLARHPTDRKKYASVREHQVKGKGRSTSSKILRDPNVPPKIGKWAVTHFQILQSTASGLRRLQVRLETGRTHQIRVHLAEAGASILADPIYGKPTKGLPNLQAQIVDSLPRLCLHAEVLGFRHPSTGENLEFRASWPQDLQKHLERLGLL